MLQSLEARTVLAGDSAAMHNADSPFDVNDDGFVSNTDLFHLVADLRRNGARAVLASAQTGAEGEDAALGLMLDVNGDNVISNADLFSMVQYLRAEAEGNMLNLNLGVTDSVGTALPGGNINRGETFQLRVSINDMRTITNTDNLGAASAYLDVEFDETQVTGGPPTTRPFTVGTGWSTNVNDQSGTINNTTGVIDEWGARQDTSSGAPTGPGDFFFIAANFKARAALDDSFNVTAGVAQDLSVRANDPTGTATAAFTSNQHETNILNDFVVWDTGSGGVGPLPLTSVFYGTAAANIQQESPFTITATSTPTKGTVSIISGGTQIRYTPTVGQTGADSFTYTVTDSQGRSDTATVSITIGTINATPVATDDNATTTAGDLGLNEGSTKPLTYDSIIAKLLANDSIGAGDTGQTLSVVSINGTLVGNGTFTGSMGGSLVIASFGTPGATMTYTPPNSDFFGDDVFTYTIRDDGTSNGNPDPKEDVGNFTFTVNPVNDPPSFAGVQGATVTRLENSGPQSVPGFATSISVGPANETGQTVSFTVTPTNAALFSSGPAISPTGTLTFTPAANANGSTTVSVFLTDSGSTANGGDATSDAQTFTINLTPVNSAPSFTKGPDQFVEENSGAHSVPTWATGISAGGADEAGQTVAFEVVVTSNPGLFSVAPSISPTGTLTYTIAPNMGGSATVQVILRDNGGTANPGDVDASAAQTFNVTIAEVNDPPTFSNAGNVTVLEDSGAHSSQWATSISPGPGNESTQTVTFQTVVDSGGTLFAVAPSVSPSGVLTFTPAAHAFGSATVTVTAVDNGSTGNPGDDNTSVPVTFNISITGVNDAPSFTKGPDQTVAEDVGARTVTGWATAISAGPNETGSQTVAFEIQSNSNPALFSVLPAVLQNGTLTYTIAPNVSGVATVEVRLVDDGGTLNSGSDTSANQSFTITVTETNDAPVGVNDFLDAEETIATTFQPADILGNDNAGPNEGTQTLSIQQLPATTTEGGTLVLNGDNTFTYTPANGFLGEDSFTYTLIDNGTTAGAGDFKTATATVTITVAPLTVPRARNDSRTTDEGNVLASINVLGNDVVNDGFALSIVGFTQPAPGTGSVVQNGDDTFTYTPPADYFGPVEFTYTIDDNDPSTNDGTSIGRVTITVNSVNDAPSFVGGPDITLNEGVGAQTFAGWASGITAGPANESGQILTFEVLSNSNPGLFTVLPAISPTGTLTFTPGADSFGMATLMVRLVDSGDTNFGGDNTSETFTFSITLESVNDVPFFTKGADQTVNEDAGAQTVTPWATGISEGAANEAGQTLTFLVTTNNDALFAVLPSVSTSGVLAYTPAANANGSAVVSVRLMDNGGTDRGGVDTSAVQTFSINVNAVNDEPSFALPADALVRNRVVAENAGAQNVVGYASSISKGPANESGQTLSFVITTSNDALFASLPAIDPTTGNLTFTSATNANGSATVTVRLRDSGGTAFGGDDESPAQTFTIVVTEVNNPPTATDDSGDDFVAVSQGGAQTFLPLANDSAGPANESGQVLRIQSITPVSPPAGGFGTIVIAPDGQSFTFEPAAGFTTGLATFDYVIVDNGTTAGAADPQTDTGRITIEVIEFTPSTIGGDIFHDVNNNGAFEENAPLPDGRREHALGGVEVRLSGTDFRGQTVLLNTTSLGDGSFTFGSVAPGNYTVTMFEPELTYGGMTTTHNVNITFDNDGNTFTEMGAARGLRSEYINPLDYMSTTPRTGAYVAFHLNNNAASTQYWFTLLDGWRHFETLTATISADRTSITIVATDTGVGTRTVTIPTAGDRRFRAYGPLSGSDFVGRILGTPDEVFGTGGAGEGEGADVPAAGAAPVAPPSGLATVTTSAPVTTGGAARLFLATSVLPEGERLETAGEDVAAVPQAPLADLVFDLAPVTEAAEFSLADEGSLGNYEPEAAGEGDFVASVDELFAAGNWLG